MDEPARVLEMVVSQLDKRMGFIEQNLVEIRGEIGQVRTELGQIRSDINQLHLDMRNNLRWMITTMVALFAVAMPAWMWVLGTILKLR